MDESDFIKIKNFCLSKNTINKVKSQFTKGEKIFSNHISERGLKSRIYSELQLNNNNNKNNPMKKWAKDLTSHFSKEDVQIFNKNMKICSASLITRARFIQTTMCYHFTPIRMTITKKIENNKCWCGYWETGTWSFPKRNEIFSRIFPLNGKSYICTFKWLI